MQRFEQLRAVWRNETLALARLRPDVFGARSRANDALLGRRIDWCVAVTHASSGTTLTGMPRPWCGVQGDQRSADTWLPGAL